MSSDEKTKFECRTCGEVFWSKLDEPLCPSCGSIICLSKEGEF